MTDKRYGDKIQQGFIIIDMILQWRHNERDGVSNYQPHHCLLNRLFGRRWNKTSKLRVTGLCAGNSPVTGEFPAQMASNAEKVFIWWRHHHDNCQQTGVSGNSLFHHMIKSLLSQWVDTSRVTSFLIDLLLLTMAEQGLSQWEKTLHMTLFNHRWKTESALGKN